MSKLSCNKCLEMADNIRIFCHGFCNQVFHPSCVDVDIDDHEHCLISPNYRWFCNDCIDLLNNFTFKKFMDQYVHYKKSSDDEVNLQHLKDEISHNRDLIQKLSDKMDGKLALAPATTSTPVRLSTTSLKRRAVDPITNSDSSIATVGTKDFELNIKTVAPKFWIHLSRFDPNTNDAEILKMATSCLNDDDIKVIKLIPKNRQLQTLEFVGFKLGVNANLKDIALNPASWPRGVYIRPFVNRQVQADVFKFPSPMINIPQIVTQPPKSNTMGQS